MPALDWYWYGQFHYFSLLRQWSGRNVNADWGFAAAQAQFVFLGALQVQELH